MGSGETYDGREGWGRGETGLDQTQGIDEVRSRKKITVKRGRYERRKIGGRKR